MNTFAAKVMLAGLLTGLALSSCGNDAGEPNRAPAALEAPAPSAMSGVAKHPEAPVCAQVGPGWRRCHAHVRLTDDGKRPLIVPMLQSAGAPTNMGFLPADLISAYNLGSAPAGSGTVAIVDAYDYAKAESDLAAYRSATGLPACTTANGCLIKVDQSGGTPDPACANDTQGCWADEMMLDLDMVSAICPACKILLVETASASSTDLNAGVAYAVQHADAVSNSYGGSEDSSIIFDTTFRASGVLITASAGDSGYGAEYPATSPYVLAVGGTSLTKDSSARGWSETAWTGTSTSQNGATGSGCSKYISKPSYQTGACTKRMESDISAVADPSTGVAIYDSNFGGWGEIGGTSASSPMIAAMFTRLGVARAVSQHAGAWPAAHVSAFYDVTSGSNESVGHGGCALSYECVCQAGYDGPTGYGTPNGAAIIAIAGGGGSGGGSGGGTGGGSGGGGVPVAPPTVSIGGVNNGQTVSGTVALNANAAASNSSALSSVTLQIDGSVVNTGTSSAAFSWNANSSGAGNHTIVATAIDADGGTAAATVQVTVVALPTVSITAPASNATLRGTSTITASASAAAGASLASLAIQIDGTEVASGASSPRSFSWDTGTVQNGSHTLTATATDADGTQATASIDVKVSNDFSISISPSSLTSAQGDVVSTATVTVTAIGSLSGGVALTASGLPQSASYEFSPAQVASGGTSTMSVLAAVATVGTYSVTVTGTGGGLTRTATLTWTIQPAPSGCSSVAPESAVTIAGLGLLVHLRARRRRASRAR